LIFFFSNLCYCFFKKNFIILYSPIPDDYCKKENVDNLTKLSGVGMRLQGKGNIQVKRYKKPMNFGDGLKMSGGRCCMCGAGNDK
jgi:hypothetical protein